MIATEIASGLLNVFALIGLYTVFTWIADWAIRKGWL